jgi:hypothetical protein
MSEKDSTRETSLGKAVEELERAERHLARAHVEEALAEQEVSEAAEELREVERDIVTVHVIHVGEVERAEFKEKRTATLQQVWDKSYLELEIPREPKDVFQTGGERPKSLMNYLGLTLEQAIAQKVIENYHFGIASETGGA